MMKLFKLNKIKEFAKKNRNLKIFIIISAAILGIKFYWAIIILKNFNFENPDSEGYLRLARNISSSYLEKGTDFTELALLRTPGYPTFIALFNSNKTIIIATQIVIHILISFLTLLVLRRILNISSFKVGILVFLLIQLETSMLVYSYRILTETLFTFLLLILLYYIQLTIKSNKLTIKFFSFSFLLLFLLLMVRPIGFALSIIFLVLIVFAKNKKIFIVQLVLILGVTAAYSSYNYVSKNVFTSSTSQNFYLFVYQGAASKALSNKDNFEIIAQEEALLRDKILGPQATYSQTDSYNRNRALELIFENKTSFLKLNMIGIFKILYSPNRIELSQLLSDNYRFKFSNRVFDLILAISILITFAISSTGIIGAVLYFKRNDNFKLLSTTLFIFVALSAGANAYGRFRVPIAPILVIYSALIIYDLTKQLKKYQTKNRFPQT